MLFSFLIIWSYFPYMRTANLVSYYLSKFDLINLQFMLILFCSCWWTWPTCLHFYSKCICGGVYLHLWCCLKFLQDMSVLHSFFSLSMVMALLCVTSKESLLCSQQSYIVSLFSMWISILCKNLAVTRKLLLSLWPLLPIWSATSGRKSKPLYSRKENR